MTKILVEQGVKVKLQQQNRSQSADDTQGTGREDGYAAGTADPGYGEKLVRRG